jgi:hypothetical protein
MSACSQRQKQWKIGVQSLFGSEGRRLPAPGDSQEAASRLPPRPWEHRLRHRKEVVINHCSLYMQRCTCTRVPSNRISLDFYRCGTVTRDRLQIPPHEGASLESHVRTLGEDGLGHARGRGCTQHAIDFSNSDFSNSDVVVHCSSAFPMTKPLCWHNQKGSSRFMERIE